jgi:hypothetical protein
MWTPTVALVRCGRGDPRGWQGCGKPLLAVKMEMCPVCNEPTESMTLRVDHTPPAPYPVPLCIPGSATMAEVIIAEIKFRSATQAEKGNIISASERIGTIKPKDEDGKRVQE